MKLEEVYDVIDRKGKKIGEATWTEVHTRGLLHKNVHGILFSDATKTKTFIKKRSKNVFQEANKYEIAVAGHVISGETPRLAIERELKEELFNSGKFPNDISITLLTTYFNNDIPNNHELAYLFEVVHPGPFNIQKEEASDQLWIDFEELQKDIKNNPSKYAQYSINAFNAYAKS